MQPKQGKANPGRDPALEDHCLLKEAHLVSRPRGAVMVVIRVAGRRLDAPGQLQLAELPTWSFLVFSSPSRQPVRSSLS